LRTLILQHGHASKIQPGNKARCIEAAVTVV